MTSKPCLLFFALIFILQFTKAQEDQRTFGDVHAKDFAKLAADTSYATILFDIGKNQVDRTSGTTFTRHIRFKLNKRGLSGRLEGDFVLIAPKGTFRKAKGTTYQLKNGQIQKFELEESSILRQRHDKKYEKIAVSFPNVVEGAIVDFEYSMEDPNYYWFPQWTFQWDAPSLVSEFTMHSPLEEYKTKLRGELKPTKYETKYDGKFQYWQIRNVPAFNKEELMPGQNAYVSSVRFETDYESWEDLFLGFRGSKLFWGRIDFTPFLNDDVRQITAGLTDSLQIVRAITQYVKSNYAFNGNDDYLADDLREVMDRKSGSAGDLNILLGAMLKKAGFPPRFLLLSTRDNGLLHDDFPSDDQFNYVICEVTVNKKKLFLDATYKELPFDMLPKKCLNHRAFLVAEKEYGWVNIEPTYRDRLNVECNAKLTKEGIEGEITKNLNGYAAAHARATLKSEGRDKVIEALKNNSTSQLENVQFQNEEDYDKPLIQSIKFSNADGILAAGDILYVNPHFLMEAEKNPFTSPSRKYPIDYGVASDKQFITNLTIPDGYELEKLPENKLFNLPGGAGRCSFNFALNGTKLTIATRLLLNNSIFYPDEYPNLREFWSRIVAKKQEQLVFRKK